MSTDPGTTRAAVLLSPDPRGGATTLAAAEPAAIDQRVAHLFRLSTRRGLIHPLQHVLLRYRRGERA